MPKIPKVTDIPIELIDDNPLSANEEDTSTFEKLKDLMEEHGLLQFPVVRKVGDRYVMLGGKHRKDAFRALGGTTIPSIVIESPMSKEEEFNLVNNFNLVHGSMMKRTISKIVRQEGLDPTKLDLFKFPTGIILPVLEEEDLRKKTAEAQRNTKINELILEVSKQIAKQMVSEKDELLTMLVVEDQVAAVIRIPFKSKGEARHKAPDIKERIKSSLVDFGSQETPIENSGVDRPNNTTENQDLPTELDK